MMDFDEIVVKESPGLCRCCLSEGCYKDLGSEYSWMSETEIYADMLLECFDISISQHPTGPNGSNRLICEVCITRLRDACNFKKQVLESEKKFVDMIGRGEFRPKVLLYQPQMKTEITMELEEETGGDEGEVEYLDEDADLVDEDLLKNESYGEPSVSEDITVSALPLKGKRGRPKKTSTSTKPEKKAKVMKVEEKPTKSKAVAKGKKLSEPAAKGPGNMSDISSTKHNRLLKGNAIIVIENSTVLPFKWHRQNYLCFFCHKVFKTVVPLKEHIMADHKKPNVKAAVSYTRREENVKIDVSAIECRLCSEKLDDLNSLIAHLSDAHDKVFTENSGSYGIIPYKLDDHNKSFQCAVCHEEYHYFLKLNEHMNSHFGNYVCEQCGKAFLSRTRLRSHVHTHGAGFRCSLCPMAFNSLSIKYNHECKVHNKEKVYRCYYCDETFQSFTHRKRHHHVVHNIEVPEFKCPVCHKSFEYESKMKVHIKEVHVREKNFTCDVCESKFFSRTHLLKHMVKHFGQRVHECEVCHKSYPRKQTLRDHMRIHNNDRRFVCAICTQAFVQSNSLRKHIRVHHPESDNK